MGFWGDTGALYVCKTNWGRQGEEMTQRSHSMWANRVSRWPNPNFVIHLPFPHVFFQISAQSVRIRKTFLLNYNSNSEVKTTQAGEWMYTPTLPKYFRFNSTITVKKASVERSFPSALRLELLWAALFSKSWWRLLSFRFWKVMNVQFAVYRIPPPQTEGGERKWRTEKPPLPREPTNCCKEDPSLRGLWFFSHSTKHCRCYTKFCDPSDFLTEIFYVYGKTDKDSLPPVSLIQPYFGKCMYAGKWQETNNFWSCLNYAIKYKHDLHDLKDGVSFGWSHSVNSVIIFSFNICHQHPHGKPDQEFFISCYQLHYLLF